MSARTKIQWCHSTVNPVMGCDGCELWPSKARVAAVLACELSAVTGKPQGQLVSLAASAVDEAELSGIYRSREDLASRLLSTADLPPVARSGLVDVIRRSAKCYAGLLATNRAGRDGYAAQFEKPERFAGRMAKAARQHPPFVVEEASKPWLAGCRRLIFVSDMGDALSGGISFDYLRTEVVSNVSSEKGQRHLWLWLTKRPGRMAQFGDWLKGQGVAWPENLVAMTTITSRDHVDRVDQLRRVPSRLKGLSLEPLFGPVDFPLQDVDWVIVGGGSDVLAESFHVEWALDMHGRCAKSGVAFFLKQLGRRPFYRGSPIKLIDKHGGNWEEWPETWRVRQLPCAFRGQS
jgi:protein gp37